MDAFVIHLRERCMSCRDRKMCVYARQQAREKECLCVSEREVERGREKGREGKKWNVVRIAFIFLLHLLPARLYFACSTNWRSQHQFASPSNHLLYLAFVPCVS